MPELRTNRLMMVGRGLVLLAVIAGLSLPAYDGDHEDAQLVVLVDQSNSVAPASSALAQEQLVADLESRQRSLNVTVSAYGPAGTPLRTVNALRDVLWKLEPASRRGVVLVSDGHWRSDVAGLLQQTSNAGVPVFWLPAESDDRSARIVSVDAPTRARPGQRVQVSVEADAPETGNYSVVIYANDEPVGRRPYSPGNPATFRVRVPDIDTLRLDAELIDADTGQSSDRLRGGSLVNVTTAPRVLVIANGFSPIAESLASGGWPVMQVAPKAFTGLVDPVSSYSALILDNVAISDMPATAWSVITAAVQRSALGLLVLGGPDSFGLGAYRGSALETVLPVISEPPQDETPASMVFLIDISGSMARQPGGSDDLRAARDAVLYTAAALRPADRVGMIGFDVEARQLLALSMRDDHTAAIRQAWPAQASGGTSVIAALNLARSALARDPAEQKLVLLVTDGMLAPEDLAELETGLKDGDFEFIAMIISDGRTEAPLSRIEIGDRGLLLMIDDVLRLPELMRDEVESLRPALVNDRTSPIVLSAPPVSGLPVNWPALDAYVVTRARPEANVILSAEGGEPLLAAWTAGAGRVLALTGGLNQWAADWLTWPQWPELAAGLMNYIAVTDRGLVRVSIEQQPANRISVLVDTGSAREMSASLPARLVPPLGPPVEISLTPDAPGRYRASMMVDQVGQYTLVWDSGGGVQRYNFVQRPEREAARQGEPLARRLVAQGLLKPWRDDSVNELARPASFKTALAALSLVLLLLTIAAERVPLSRLRRDASRDVMR